MRAVLAGTEWLSDADISMRCTQVGCANTVCAIARTSPALGQPAQKDPPASKSDLATHWQSIGRIFSVNVDGQDLFPGYQFDTVGQPLPVIFDILKEFGPVVDSWKLAAWFHFPNTWLVERDGDKERNVAPKDRLNSAMEVLIAAKRRTGSYVA